MNHQNLYQEGVAIRKDEEMVMFDFSKEEHRNYLTAELGGEAYFKSAFPELYQQYQEAVLRDTKNKKMKLEVQVGEPDVFQDAVDIFYGFYDSVRERVVCKGITSIQKNAKHISHGIRVYDGTGNLVIASGYVEYNCHHAVYELNEPVKLSERQKQQGLIFDYFSLWYTGENGLQAAYYSTEDRLAWNAVDYVESVNIIDPVHKKTSPDEPIVVCYNRTSQSGEQIDYDEYEEAYDPVTHRQWLYLDVGADVQLSKDAGSFSGMDITKFLLKLDCQSGIAYYKKEGRVQEILDKFKATDTGFTFQLDKDWKGVVPAARLPMVEPLDFLLRLEFTADDYSKRGRLVIASDESMSEAGGFVKAISKLHLLWGCVADDTLVRMADGSCMQIKNIRIGDRICTKNMGDGYVEDIIEGREEEPLLYIETRNGRNLCCTKYHPILTRRGFVTAGELTGADEVMDVDRNYDAITAIYPKKHEKVINLLVRTDKEDGTWICNDLVTGDFRLQNQMTIEVEKKKREDMTLISEEMEALRHYFSER